MEDNRDLFELSKDELIFFIECYNSYITSYFHKHDINSNPINMYEFYNNNFQEIVKLKEKILKEIEDYVHQNIVPNNRYETFEEIENCYSDLANNINVLCQSSTNITIIRYLDNLDTEPTISYTDLDNGIEEILTDYELY